MFCLFIYLFLWKVAKKNSTNNSINTKTDTRTHTYWLEVKLFFHALTFTIELSSIGATKKTIVNLTFNVICLPKTVRNEKIEDGGRERVNKKHERIKKNNNNNHEPSIRSAYWADICIDTSISVIMVKSKVMTFHLPTLFMNGICDKPSLFSFDIWYPTTAARSLASECQCCAEDIQTRDYSG